MQKLQKEPTSQTRGTARNGREQTKATPALARQRTSRSQRLKIPPPDIPTAVERKNDHGKPERELIKRKHVVHEQVRRRQSATVVRDEIASLPEVQRQEEEVSSSDKSATSPDTEAVPMRRWRIDRIIEEASQYHPDRARSFDFDRLSGALGSQDPDFIWGSVMQLVHAGTHFHDGQLLGFMLSVLENIRPRDAIEAMLGAQIAAVHMSMMNYVDEFARLDRTIDPLHVNFRQEMADRALNKLSRTFATLVGALKNYRTGGEQKLTFGPVSVNDGGQAVLGTFNQAPRDVLPEKTPTATPALTDGRQTAMEIVDERKREPVPQRRRQKG